MLHTNIYMCYPTNCKADKPFANTKTTALSVSKDAFHASDQSYEHKAACSPDSNLVPLVDNALVELPAAESAPVAAAGAAAGAGAAPGFQSCPVAFL